MDPFSCSGPAFPTRLSCKVGRTVYWLKSSWGEKLERMPIKLLPSPGRAVCNEVRAHYKSNTISELAGSLPLYFFFFFHFYFIIISNKVRVKPNLIIQTSETTLPFEVLSLNSKTTHICSNSSKPEPEPPPFHHK